MSATAHLTQDEQETVNRRLSGLCSHGFHFCLACQRVTVPRDTGRQVCGRCGSHRVRWCPPVLNFAGPETKTEDLTPTGPKV